MQTFITYPEHRKTAASLDSKRLNKQLLECRQILNIILNPEVKGWRNHPAVKMWEEHPEALFDYAIDIASELEYRDIAWKKNWDAIVYEIIPPAVHRGAFEPFRGTAPLWMTDEKTLSRLIMTHRARLFEKDSIHYAQWQGCVEYAEPCCDRCNYYWPTHVEE